MEHVNERGRKRLKGLLDFYLGDCVFCILVERVEEDVGCVLGKHLLRFLIYHDASKLTHYELGLGVFL